MLLAFATIHAWAQSTSDIGKVLAADGKMYKTVAAAVPAQLSLKTAWSVPM